MTDTEKMNEAMYERLGEIVFKADNARTICNSASGADEKNLQLLAAFTDLRQMCEFYKPEAKEPVVPGCPSLMPRQLPGGFNGVEPAEKLAPSSELQAPSSEQQREEARQKRKIHWTAYPTKVDIAVMGKTEQNGKVYEVRVSKRSDSKVQDTYGQCKVNGKTVITCSFAGGAWMLKRILTAGMQALVNYKAKKSRDSRRNLAKRRAAAKQQAHDNKGEAAKEVK